MNSIRDFISRHDPAYFKNRNQSQGSSVFHAHTVKPLDPGGLIKPGQLISTLKRVKRELVQTDRFNSTALCNDDSEVKRLYEEVAYKIALSACHLELMRSKKQKTTAAMTSYLHYPNKPFKLGVLLGGKYWDEHTKLGGLNAEKLTVSPTQGV